MPPENEITDLVTGASVSCSPPGDPIQSRGAVKYIAAGVTLRSDGTAAGQVEYDVAVRVPLASGIAGYALNDTHDFTGTWSASGDSIHVGGRSYRYATPDPETVILLFEDTVELRNNAGTKSREPVQIYLKLHRI